MPDEPQNPIPEENSIPVSPQEPAGPISQDIRVSEPSNMPLEAPESPKNADIPVSLNNANSENEPISTPSPEEAIPLEPTDIQVNPASNGTSEPSVEPISEPVQAIEPSTAQMAGNEPLTPEPENKIEPNIQEVKPEPVSVSNSGVASEMKSEPELKKVIPIPIIVSNKNKIFELLAKAKNAIQFRKRKKLNRIMTLFLKKSKITNDEIEKFLHVSDATATRYLSQLEKEGKIKQNGKTGKRVFYSKI